jgi:hypothetical protein
MLFLYLEWLMSGNLKKWIIIAGVILALGLFLAQIL